VLTLHNAGSQDTPILENILPLDVVVKLAPPDKLIFHHVHGSAFGWIADYVPVDKEMTSGEDLELAHYVFENGKHSDTFLPFFNAQWSSGGLMGAIGWTGQWMVRASRSSNGLVLKSGQQKRISDCTQERLFALRECCWCSGRAEIGSRVRMHYGKWCSLTMFPAFTVKSPCSGGAHGRIRTDL